MPEDTPLPEEQPQDKDDPYKKGYNDGFKDGKNNPSLDPNMEAVYSRIYDVLSREHYAKAEDISRMNSILLNLFSDISSPFKNSSNYYFSDEYSDGFKISMMNNFLFHAWNTFGRDSSGKDHIIGIANTDYIDIAKTFLKSIRPKKTQLYNIKTFLSNNWDIYSWTIKSLMGHIHNTSLIELEDKLSLPYYFDEIKMGYDHYSPDSMLPKSMFFDNEDLLLLNLGSLPPMADYDSDITYISDTLQKTFFSIRKKYISDLENTWDIISDSLNLFEISDYYMAFQLRKKYLSNYLGHVFSVQDQLDFEATSISSLLNRYAFLNQDMGQGESMMQLASESDYRKDVLESLEEVMKSSSFCKTKMPSFEVNKKSVNEFANIYTTLVSTALEIINNQDYGITYW